MKYRAEHNTTTKYGGDCRDAASYYAFSSTSQPQQRTNGQFAQAAKTNRFIASGTDASDDRITANGPIELVEKILNQINTHQSASSNNNNNDNNNMSSVMHRCCSSSGSNNHNSTLIGGNGERTRNSVAKKNHYNGNYNGHSNKNTAINSNNNRHNNHGKCLSSLASSYANHNRNKEQSQNQNPHHNVRSLFAGSSNNEPESAPDSDGNEQCSQCEYVFDDGILFPKVECNHKAKMIPRKVLAHPDLLPAEEKKRTGNRSNNHHAYHANNRPPSNSNKSTTVSSARSFHANQRVKRGAGQANGAQHQFAHGRGSVSGFHHTDTAHWHMENMASQIAEIDSCEQSVVSQTKNVKMKKFVEAHIFLNNRNIIDVVPLHCVPSQCLIEEREDEEENEVEKVEKKKENNESERSETSKLNDVLSPLKKMPTFYSVSEQTNEFLAVDRKYDRNNSGLSSISKSKAAGNTCGKPVPPTKLTLRPSEPKCSSTNSMAANLCRHRSSSQQAVKKIRCLIANFITIQVEDGNGCGMIEAGNGHFPTVNENKAVFVNVSDDILQAIDREKLGFQNFDGKNIGLYKNIGYINRNRVKFARPTKELLQLLLLPKANVSGETTLNIGVRCDTAARLGDQNYPHYQQQHHHQQPSHNQKNQHQHLELDLSAFYDTTSPDSYDKEYAYSVLESLINDDSELTSHIKARKYRYPDCEYDSSECDDYPVNEPFCASSGGRARTGGVSAATSESSSLDKSHAWSQISENERAGGNGGENRAKFTMTRYIYNSTILGAAASNKSNISATTQVSAAAAANMSNTITNTIDADQLSGVDDNGYSMVDEYGPDFYITQVVFILS